MVLRYAFWGLVVLLIVFFLLIQIPFLLVLWSTLSGGGLDAIIFGKFFWGFYLWQRSIFYVLECKGWIYVAFGVVTFEVEVLLGVSGFVVNGCASR